MIPKHFNPCQSTKITNGIYKDGVKITQVNGLSQQSALLFRALVAQLRPHRGGEPDGAWQLESSAGSRQGRDQFDSLAALSAGAAGSASAGAIDSIL